MVHVKSTKMQCMPVAKLRQHPSSPDGLAVPASSGTDSLHNTQANSSLSLPSHGGVITTLQMRPQSRPSSAVGGAKFGRKPVPIVEPVASVPPVLCMPGDVDGSLEGFFKRLTTS